jgi:hypothetical protein
MADGYDHAMSYQPPYDWMSWDLSSLIEKDQPPPSVRNAARLMYAGAAIDALTAILALAAYFRLWSGMASASTLQLTPSQWHQAMAFGAGFIIIAAVFRIGMWLWMASKSKAGRRWARVLSTVCFVIDSVALVSVIARPTPGGEWQLLFPLAIWLVGGCAVALLWQRESSEFFTAQSRRY